MSTMETGTHSLGGPEAPLGLPAAALKFGGGISLNEGMYFPSGSQAHNPEASVKFQAGHQQRIEKYQSKFAELLDETA
jgi:hypothetical protein